MPAGLTPVLGPISRLKGPIGQELSPSQPCGDRNRRLTRPFERLAGTRLLVPTETRDPKRVMKLKFVLLAAAVLAVLVGLSLPTPNSTAEPPTESQIATLDLS